MKTISSLFLALFIIASCQKETIEYAPKGQAVTFKIVATGDTVVHWHSVRDTPTDSALTRYRNYPKYSEVVPGCDSRIQILIIGPDHCFN